MKKMISIILMTQFIFCCVCGLHAAERKKNKQPFPPPKPKVIDIKNPADNSMPSQSWDGLERNDSKFTGQKNKHFKKIIETIPPRPGYLKILSPEHKSFISKYPVSFEIEFDGSVQLNDMEIYLEYHVSSNIINETIKIDIVSYFIRENNRLKAIIDFLKPGRYEFIVKGKDALENDLEDIISFNLDKMSDLAVLQTLVMKQAPPVKGLPLDIQFRVRNEGNMTTPPTTINVTFIKETSAATKNAGDDYDYRPVELKLPELAPNEEIEMPDREFLRILEEAESNGWVEVIVDPYELIHETDEENNKGLWPINPGLSSWRNMEVRLVNVDVLSLSYVRFQVAFKNVGNIPIEEIRLRYVLRYKKDTGEWIDFWDAGGEAGHCIDQDQSGHRGLRIVSYYDAYNPNPLEMGEGIIYEVSENFTSHTSPEGKGRTGEYELCVESIVAKELTDTEKACRISPTCWELPTWSYPVYWEKEPRMPETDRFGDPAYDDNHDSFTWDVGTLPDLGTDADINVGNVWLTDTRAGFTSKVNLSLRNQSPQKYGTAKVKIRCEAMDGRGKGQFSESNYVHVNVVSPNTLVRDISLFPGNINPAANNLKLTVEVISTDPTETVLIAEDWYLKLAYFDYEVIDMSTDPIEEYIFKNNPAEVNVLCKNWSSDPVSVTVNFQSPPGNMLDSQSVDIPGNGDKVVTFNFLPASTGSYTLRSNMVGLVESQGVPTNDNYIQKQIQVTDTPSLYVLDYKANTSSPLAYGNTIPLKITFFAKNIPSGGTSFTVKIYDYLEGRYIYGPTSITIQPSDGSTSEGIAEKTFNWSPNRAGYHTHRVEIDNQTEFKTRFDVAPQVTVLSTDRITLYYEEAYDVKSSGNYFQAWTEASIAGYYKSDSSKVTIIDTYKINISGGSNNDTPYFLNIRVNTKFSGVVNNNKAFYIWPTYASGIAVGIKPAGSSCWNADDSNCGIIAQRNLWRVRSGQFTNFDVLTSEEFRFGEAIWQLTGEILEITPDIVQAGRVAQLIDIAWDVGNFIADVSNCDHDVEVDRPVEFKLPLTNGDYIIYLVNENKAGVTTAAGTGYTYADFHGEIYGTNCGGKREGIKLHFAPNNNNPDDQTGVTLVNIPTGWFNWED